MRAIRGIVRSVTIHSKRLYRDTGLTLPQMLCLRAMDQASLPVTAAQIARDVQLSPATVTGIVDRLERNELVSRRRDLKDRRKVYLSLTPKGQDRLVSLPSSLQDRAVRRLNALSEDERRAILDALSQLLGILDASVDEASPILAPGDDHRTTSLGLRL